jgi:hypothetical protein
MANLKVVPTELNVIASQIIVQDLAISCLLETLAKREPGIAEAVAAAMKENSNQLWVNRQPGLREKIDEYIRLIQSGLAKNPR